jgi:hypothetical protein
MFMVNLIDGKTTACTWTLAASLAITAERQIRSRRFGPDPGAIAKPPSGAREFCSTVWNFPPFVAFEFPPRPRL